jgi:glycosyltransferase involved in cell wall biosynthesis
MKILLLTDINSPHSMKWAKGLADRGIRVGIFSISSPADDWYTPSSIEVFIPVKFNQGIFSSGILRKIKYLRLVRHLKKVIREFKPDILHSHYASSYGLLGALSGFHPYIISVWGSDIYYFPRIPVFGQLILKFNFRKADAILSTSNAMLPFIQRFTSKVVTVTPFGIDTTTFRPATEKQSGTGDIVIGTVKLLEKVYGIDNLMKAFAGLKNQLPSSPLKLLIVGGGSQDKELKMLAGELGIMQETTFTGPVPSGEVPAYFQKLDIYVALSISESFGVAILEASSCGIPVVVSDAGGLPEVVSEGETGFIIPAGDIGKTVNALEKLILDEQLRVGMGKKGRAFVKARFDLQDSVDRMIKVYENIKSK